MPFPWYHPDVPPSFSNAPEKANRMYEQELFERAALLMRLGYSDSETKKRLSGNVGWDFELHHAPTHLNRVAAIVKQVFKHRGAISSGVPSLD
ncbi:MAG: hypothetical protein V1754_14175 [Pseudomonadota bacterium]